MDRVDKYLQLKKQFNIREEEGKKESEKIFRILLENNDKKLKNTKNYNEKLKEDMEKQLISIEKKFKEFTEEEKDYYIAERRKFIEEHNNNIEPWEVNKRIGGIDRKIHFREVPIYKRREYH